MLQSIRNCKKIVVTVQVRQFDTFSTCRNCRKCWTIGSTSHYRYKIRITTKKVATCCFAAELIIRIITFMTITTRFNSRAKYISLMYEYIQQTSGSTNSLQVNKTLLESTSNIKYDKIYSQINLFCPQDGYLYKTYYFPK